MVSTLLRARESWLKWSRCAWPSLSAPADEHQVPDDELNDGTVGRRGSAVVGVSRVLAEVMMNDMYPDPKINNTRQRQQFHLDAVFPGSL